MHAILQARLPYEVTQQRLPGVRGCRLEDWLMQDDAFGAQMALREKLLTTKRAHVIAMTPEGRTSASELLDYVLGWLQRYGAGYEIQPDKVRRPDGVVVRINHDDPLGTLGQLVQEDLCLLEKCGEVHRMTAAVVCFPANWHLSEKIGQPLTDIHAPVPQYDATLAKRVQKLFDGVQVGQPIWRFNALNYADPSLFQPDKHDTATHAKLPYFRSERQTILRLPGSGACVFAIHTYVLERKAMDTGLSGYSVPEISRSIE